MFAIFFGKGFLCWDIIGDLTCRPCLIQWSLSQFATALRAIAYRVEGN